MFALPTLMDAQRPSAMFAGGLALLGLGFVALIAYCRRTPDPVARPPLRLGEQLLGALLGAAGGIVVLAMGAWLAVLASATGDAPSSIMTLIAASLLGAVVGATAVRCSWHVAGAMTLLGLVLASVGYLSIGWSSQFGAVAQGMGQSAGALTITLLVAQTTSLTMVSVYAFYSLDGIAKRKWRRHKAAAPHSREHEPIVAFHVCVYNEPPQLVVDCLKSLLALDYPPEKRLLFVLDDSTDAAACVVVSEFCAQNEIRYLHRDERRGFKAGALNEALAVTPAEVEVIAILDADYQVKPDYLRGTVGYFVDPALAFLQTPQEYRNRDESFLTEQCYLQDAFFYRSIMCTRNEENAIIFCGTMGMLRREALVAVGGWGEDHVCEDAEISVRLLEKKYRSLYVDEPFGHGLLPSTFAAYKAQQYRWSFGGVRIVRAHWRKFFTSRISWRQKMDFLVGGLHWFDGLYTLAIVATVAAMAFSALLGFDLAPGRHRELWSLALLPAFIIVDGVLRLHLTLRRVAGANFGQTLLVMGLWWSIKLSNLKAASAALSARKLSFSRTPKVPVPRRSRSRALREAWAVARSETTLALSVLLLAAAVAVHAWRASGGFLTALAVCGWLAYYGAYFGMAPMYAYLSARTLAPKQGGRAERSSQEENPWPTRARSSRSA